MTEPQTWIPKLLDHANELGERFRPLEITLTDEANQPVIFPNGYLAMYINRRGWLMLAAWTNGPYPQLALGLWDGIEHRWTEAGAVRELEAGFREKAGEILGMEAVNGT